ncbi:Gfo/Idh/MocA family oxidoreductase [Sphingomonas sp. CGMCC 1.13654]|uniref:Gfo/Idh/MocA family oxidoreductase n=1 Tax=Sphingomonas chungangi TaxID=2683589 RepID=A0A838L5Y6_9SPHN|nr:Gfo/Idh/MocA family oxidoreductase [Sphingomonas chungangi]MBA2932998.1 Gfo/Idh/MocA family oxidoreductase [Sphingomonas chungangi]MVW56618.1 oxidoreductase [Sphingomonas chungangi]
MNGPPPIRVGLVGYGLAGAILHAPIIEALPDYRIAAVMTSRAEAGDRRDGPAVVPDIDALLAVEGIDLVVVVTPNELHAAHAEVALRAGKHVVIDKPMAPDVAACDRLIDLASRRGRVLSVYHNRRWDGDFLALRREVEAIGAPALFAACWDRFRPETAAVWRNEPRPGAGLLWDLGPHMIDQAIQLFGWPDAMTTDIATQRAGAGADDYFALTLRHGAMRTTISASTLVAATRPRMALHGTKGSWWTEGLDPVEAALRAGQSPADPGFVRDLPAIPAFRAHTDGERIAAPVLGGDPFAFYRLLSAAIRGEGPPPVDPIDARNVVALIDAAHRGAPLPPPRLPDNAGHG